METQKGDEIALRLSVAMGTYFVYVGGLKIFSSGLEKFAVDIGNYKLLGQGLSVAAAYIVAWMEVIAGLCFMLGVLRKGAWLAMLGLVLAFSVSVGSAWWRGLDISCGCTGGSEKISYWAKAAEFTLYYAVLGFLALVWWRKTPRAKA